MICLQDTYEEFSSLLSRKGVPYYYGAPPCWPFPPDDTDGTYLNKPDGTLYIHDDVLVIFKYFEDEMELRFDEDGNEDEEGYYDEDGDELNDPVWIRKYFWVSRVELEKVLGAFPQEKCVTEMLSASDGVSFDTPFNSVLIEKWGRGEEGEVEIVPFWAAKGLISDYQQLKYAKRTASLIFGNQYKLAKCSLTGQRHFISAMRKGVALDGTISWYLRESIGGTLEPFQILIRGINSENYSSYGAVCTSFIACAASALVRAICEPLNQTQREVMEEATSRSFCSPPLFTFTVSDVLSQKVFPVFTISPYRENRARSWRSLRLHSFVGVERLEQRYEDEISGLLFLTSRDRDRFQNGCQVSPSSASSWTVPQPPTFERINMPGSNQRPHKIWNYSKDIVDFLGLTPATFYRSKKFDGDKPLPKKTPFFGVELEVQPHKVSTEDAFEKVYTKLGNHNIICKDDASIGRGGFEIVSAPCTLGYHREMWPEFFKTSREYLRSWNTETCGIHVHISKNAFTENQMDAFVHFFDRPENLPFIQTVAGRSIEEYARANHEKKIKDKDRAKYRACNIDKPNTLEVRIFRGSVHPNGFFKALEFVASLHEFIITLNSNASEEKRNEALDFTNYLQWLRKKDKRYPVLLRWLRFRGFYTKNKGLVAKTKTKEMVKPVLERIAERDGKLKSKGTGITQKEVVQRGSVVYQLGTHHTVGHFLNNLKEVNNLPPETTNEELAQYFRGSAVQKVFDGREKSARTGLYICNCDFNPSYWYIFWDHKTQEAVVWAYNEYNAEITNQWCAEENLYYEAKQVRRKKKLNLYDLIDKDIEKDFNEDNPTYKEM